MIQAEHVRVPVFLKGIASMRCLDLPAGGSGTVKRVT
jgi:hypothetical protein